MVPSGVSFEQSECPLDLEAEGNASTDAAPDRKVWKGLERHHCTCNH